MPNGSRIPRMPIDCCTCVCQCPNIPTSGPAFTRCRCRQCRVFHYCLNILNRHKPPGKEDEESEGHSQNNPCCGPDDCGKGSRPSRWDTEYTSEFKDYSGKMQPGCRCGCQDGNQKEEAQEEVVTENEMGDQETDKDANADENAGENAGHNSGQNADENMNDDNDSSEGSSQNDKGSQTTGRKKKNKGSGTSSDSGKGKRGSSKGSKDSGRSRKSNNNNSSDSDSSKKKRSSGGTSGFTDVNFMMRSAPVHLDQVCSYDNLYDPCDEHIVDYGFDICHTTSYTQTLDCFMESM